MAATRPQPTLVRLDVLELIRLTILIGGPLVSLIVLVITTKVQLASIEHRLDRIERIVDVIAYDHATRPAKVQHPPPRGIQTAQPK